MAWMASNIYIESADHAGVAAAVKELLGQEGHRADHAGLLDPPGPVVVSPAHEGWVAVTGVRAWFDDPVWAAQKLSAACDAAVVSCEIIGNSYRLCLSLHRAGRDAEVTRFPDHGWNLEATEPKTMPLYEDTEKLAFTRLVELSVPLPLITIGTLPLGFPKATLDLGQGAGLRPSDRGVKQDERPVKVVDYEGEDPPVLPTETTRDFGLMCFEDRYVEGHPGDDAVDRLLQIEKEMLARADRAQPQNDVSLTVSYHASIHQDRMDELLRIRNRHTLPSDQLMQPPWWQFWRYLGKFR